MRAVRRWARARVLALALGLAGYATTGLVGCGRAADFPVDDAADGADDGETVDGGDRDAADEAGTFDAGPEPPIGACNNLQPGDNFVSPDDTGVTTTPSAEGGTLVSGVYHLISTNYYPSRLCARDPVATTLVVEAASATSGALQLATGLRDGTALTESIRYSNAGTFLITRIDCSSSDPGGVQGSAAILSYSATATEMRLVVHVPGCGSSVDSYQM